MKLKELLLHFVSLIFFGYTFYYDLFIILPKVQAKHINKVNYFRLVLGNLKYLTFLNLVIQVVYYAFCFLIPDLLCQNSITVQKIRATFISVGLTLNLFVVSTFWAIYAIDRELIFPKVLDSIIPTWWNHSAHTIVWFAMVADVLISKPLRSPRGLNLKILITFSLAYLIGISLLYHNTGHWVYPIFNALNNIQRAMFMTGCFVMMILIYFFNEIVLNLIYNQSKSNINESRRIPQMQQQKSK